MIQGVVFFVQIKPLDKCLRLCLHFVQQLCKSLRHLANAMQILGGTLLLRLSLYGFLQFLLSPLL